MGVGCGVWVCVGGCGRLMLTLSFFYFILNLSLFNAIQVLSFLIHTSFIVYLLNRKHDLTDKKTMTMTMTMTFSKHFQRAILLSSSPKHFTNSLQPQKYNDVSQWNRKTISRYSIGSWKPGIFGAGAELPYRAYGLLKKSRPRSRFNGLRSHDAFGL